MTGNELCPFNNANCMCQFCTEPCNNGLNCWECKSKDEQVHSVYLCTGFKGDLNRYLATKISRSVNLDKAFFNAS